MPIPLFGIIVAASALLGGKKTLDAIQNNIEAKKINIEAKLLYEEAQGKLSQLRDETSQVLVELGKQKINVLNNEMKTFLDIAEKVKSWKLGFALWKIKRQNKFKESTVKFIEASDGDFANLKSMCVNASDLVTGGIATVGTGSLLAVAAYNGVAALGSASTGTAICTLNGIAASNATLAWLGGGTLASGGGGIVGGVAVLGGIVAAPVLAVGGFILASKAEENLAIAQINLDYARSAADEMERACSVLQQIKSYALECSEIIRGVSYKMRPNLRYLSGHIVNKVKFSNLEPIIQRNVESVFKCASVLNVLLTAPIITSDGSVSPNYRDILDKARKEIGDYYLKPSKK